MYLHFLWLVFIHHRVEGVIMTSFHSGLFLCWRHPIHNLVTFLQKSVVKHYLSKRLWQWNWIALRRYHSVAQCTVLAMRQVNGGGSFSATSEILETDSAEIWRVWLRPPSDPHVKYDRRREWGIGCAYGWSFTLACFFIFVFFSVYPQFPRRSVDFRSMHPKMCFDGGCVPLGLVYLGGQIFRLYP